MKLPKDNQILGFNLYSVTLINLDLTFHERGVGPQGNVKMTLQRTRFMGLPYLTFYSLLDLPSQVYVINCTGVTPLIIVVLLPTHVNLEWIQAIIMLYF